MLFYLCSFRRLIYIIYKQWPLVCAPRCAVILFRFSFFITVVLCCLFPPFHVCRHQLHYDAVTGTFCSLWSVFIGKQWYSANNAKQDEEHIVFSLACWHFQWFLKEKITWIFPIWMFSHLKNPVCPLLQHICWTCQISPCPVLFFCSNFANAPHFFF